MWNPGPPSHPDYYRIVEGGSLVAKSYVPYMLFMVRRLNVYITKHQSTIFKYVGVQAHRDAITNCNQCLGSLLALLDRPVEGP